MQRFVTLQASHISDSDRVKIGGGGINLRRPAPKKQPDVSDNSKVKTGGAYINLRKPIIDNRPKANRSVEK